MLLFALAACTTIQPQDGLYIGEVRDFEADAICAEAWFDVAALQAANATEVQLAEDGESFTLEGEVDCTLFRVDFNCLKTYDERVTGGAYVETRLVIEGEWVSSYAFVSDWELSGTCEGEDCPDDCFMSWTFDPTLAG